MKRSVLLLFILFTTTSFAQLSEEQFIKDSPDIIKLKLVRPQLKFDNRINFYGSQPLSITGVDAGVLLAEKLRLTLGYYRMNNSLKDKEVTKNDTTVGTLIHLEYGSINTELMYKDTRFFSLGMPLEIAAGVKTFTDKNITADQVLGTRTGALTHIGRT